MFTRAHQTTFFFFLDVVGLPRPYCERLLGQREKVQQQSHTTSIVIVNILAHFATQPTSQIPNLHEEMSVLRYGSIPTSIFRIQLLQNTPLPFINLLNMSNLHISLVHPRPPSTPPPMGQYSITHVMQARPGHSSIRPARINSRRSASPCPWNDGTNHTTTHPA